MTSKELVKSVYKQTRQELLSHGWAKCKKWEIYLKKINENVVGKVSFDYVSHARADLIEFSATVSVSYKPLDLLYTDLTGTDVDPCSTATLAINLGYLMPEKTFLKWHYYLNDDHFDAQATAKNMMATFIRYGYPWMEVNSTFDAFYKRILREERQDFCPPYYRPLFHLLAKDYPSAIKEAEMMLENWPDDGTELSKSWRQLANRIIDRAHTKFYR